MSLPTTPAAYNDCYELWAAGASFPGGCRAMVGPVLSQAEYLRMRMHQARQLLRDQSRRAYPKDHPAWNTSEYDGYKIIIKQDDDGDYWLYVEHHGNWAAVSTIEPIPADELPVQPNEAIAHLSQTRLHLTAPTTLQLESIPNANPQDDLD